MGQRLRSRFELPFCNATERILKEFEIVLFTLKPERRPLALAMKVMIFSVVAVIESSSHKLESLHHCCTLMHENSEINTLHY